MGRAQKASFLEQRRNSPYRFRPHHVRTGLPCRGQKSAPCPKCWARINVSKHGYHRKRVPISWDRHADYVLECWDKTRPNLRVVGPAKPCPQNKPERCAFGVSSLKTGVSVSLQTSWKDGVERGAIWPNASLLRGNWSGFSEWLGPGVPPKIPTPPQHRG